jgi:16S rRNA (cytidine1402-2'-O)-methyltransferase
MIVQQSFNEEKPSLYLVSTPIGNLEDISIRAIEILKQVDLIYAEDTRNSIHLLKHYEIKTPLKSYHMHNENDKVDDLIETIKKGKSIALISDAGTPLINDPGESLVKACIEAFIPVVSIPGASAFLTALTSSNLSTQPFLFYGFLPSKAKARHEALETLKTLPYTLIFYEAPHRILETLKALKEVFINRSITIARELTKKFETYMHLSLDEIDKVGPLKGEIVLIVEGLKELVVLDKFDIIEHIELLKADGLSEMDAIKKAAKDRNMKKNDVYMAFKNHKKHFNDKE